MKGSADFHFKQFTVRQKHSTHKVGTDGVLLGVWANIQNARRILDIGTGTGLIALMLAQRTARDVSIDAVEIEATDIEQARENVQSSPWPSKITIHNMAIQDYQYERGYDLIVSNPPYFVDSWLPPDSKRSQARHTLQLSFDDLLRSSKRLLNKDGRLAVVLPYTEGQQFIQQAHLHQLYCIRQLAIRSRAQKPIERLLLEFNEKAEPVIQEEIILYAEGNAWSEDYRRLTKEFYLRV